MKQEERTAGSTGICYVLTRKNVKNINLRVRPDGTVHLSANPHVPIEVIEQFLARKAPWIQSAQRRFRNTPQPQKHCAGEMFYYLGGEYPVVLCQGKQEGVVFERNTLFVTCPVPEKEARFRCEALLGRWYRNQARQVFSEICDRVHSRFFEGTPKPELRLRRMKSQWGNCRAARNIITLNTRLIEVPYECVEYVAMHEFAHLVEQNHSERFYAALRRMLPDYPQRKALLKVWGSLILPN